MDNPYACQLQILVPQYNETDEIIKPLLDSIQSQENVSFDNFSVIITNDGSDIKLSREFLDTYSFHIDYYFNEHHGVSATRNYCLDKSTAKYVMFCDADDAFYGNNGLAKVFKAIEQNFDCIMFSFLEESKDKDTGEVSYEEHFNDGIFIHAKVFKREYLVKNNIRFDETLCVNEDANFVHICRSLSKDVADVHDVIYVWKWREGSVSRKSEEFHHKCVLIFIDASDKLIQELLRRSVDDEAAACAVYTIIFCFYIVENSDFTDYKNGEFYDKAIQLLETFIPKYRHMWNQVIIAKKKRMIKDVAEDAVPSRYYDKELKFIEEWMNEFGKG